MGNDFSVLVSKDGFSANVIEDVAINLGKVLGLELVLSSASKSTTLEEVTIFGTATTNEVAAGQSASFDIDTLSSTPAINRDIVDVLRTDSRIYIDEASENQVQCAGKNPRFNSLTVDGVRLNDSFGLNQNLSLIHI